jgi:uncharacterized cofD-like protein
MIVCFGGGTGLSATVRALKDGGEEFAAVVSTTDNGGSTGRLREEFGIPAVGDFRKVVNSLAAGDFATTMESRHGGHALGNLALLDLTKRLGFDKGTAHYRKAMGVSELVLPQFLEPCDLAATIDGREVLGEVQIDHSKGRVDDVRLDGECEVSPHVLELVESADTAVFGPGSLYTSIVPHFLGGDMARRLSKIHNKVFVMVIRNDLPVVKGFKLSDYLRVVDGYVKMDHVLVQDPERGVRLDASDGRLVRADMALDGHVHDPRKLGDALCKLL